MRSYLQILVTGLLSSFLMASCSQSKEIVSEDRSPQYRYNKVYVGNQILYRGIDNDKGEVDRLIMSDLEERKELAREMELSSAGAAAASETEAEDDSQILTNKESVFKDIGKTFTTNLSEIRRGTFRGTLMQESAQKIESNYSALSSEDDDKPMAGASEIFAVLGFIFGLGSFIGSIWFVGAILGVVFSILGWNSDWHIFALLGLIFSVAGAVLAIAGVI